jgi:hypothetical protein
LVPRFASRYPDRLYELIERLDGESLPLAEVARRIGSAAEAEGITRPEPGARPQAPDEPA